MATKTFTPSNDKNWDNAANWVGGLPLPGDTAVITNGDYAYINALTLDDVRVDLVHGIISGSDLSLVDSQVVMSGRNVSPSFNNAIATLSLEVDRMSFIIDNNVGVSRLTQTQTTNEGTIGVETSGAELLVFDGPTNTSTKPGEFGNTGQLIASNGGLLVLAGADVNGSGGQIKVANGGILDLYHSTIDATEQVSLGGQDRTTLALDPSSSVAALISGFLPTDTIDLLDFKATTIAQIGTVNPTLVVVNPLAPYTGGIFDEVIHLSGNYAHYRFALSPDANGTGTDLTVHPST